MFELLELLVDLHELKLLGLYNEEIEGYMEMFGDNYNSDSKRIEIV